MLWCYCYGRQANPLLTVSTPTFLCGLWHLEPCPKKSAKELKCAGRYSRNLQNSLTLQEVRQGAGAPLVQEGERWWLYSSRKTSGTPQTRVMGDEEGTGIQFENLSGGGEEDQWLIQEGLAFRPYIERCHAPPLWSVHVGLSYTFCSITGS